MPAMERPGSAPANRVAVGGVGCRMVDLTRSHGGQAEAGWWDRVRPHSLGWVTARTEGRELVGFVNVAWDGGDHAILIDTKTRPTHQRQGLGVAVVSRAIAEVHAVGCEWLFVDFEPQDYCLIFRP